MSEIDRMSHPHHELTEIRLPMFVARRIGAHRSSPALMIRDMIEPVQSSIGDGDGQIRRRSHGLGERRGRAEGGAGRVRDK